MVMTTTTIIRTIRLPVVFLYYCCFILLLFSASCSSTIFKEEEKNSSSNEIITVAGGCFWSVELSFQRIPGVLLTEVGYVRSAKDDNNKNDSSTAVAVTYKTVSKGHTGYAEALRITFDTNIVTTNELYDFFMELHDPTTLNRQGGDIGTQYRSAIFYHTEEQHQIAMDSIRRQQGGVVTEVSLVGKWHTAEEYHQKYLLKGGQDASKGSVVPIQCYGNRGPKKNLEHMLSDVSMSVLLGTNSKGDGEL